MGSSMSCFGGGGGGGSARDRAVMRESKRRRDGRIFTSSFAHSGPSSVVVKVNRRKRAAQARAQRGDRGEGRRAGNAGSYPSDEEIVSGETLEQRFGGGSASVCLATFDELYRDKHAWILFRIVEDGQVKVECAGATADCARSVLPARSARYLVINLDIETSFDELDVGAASNRLVTLMLVWVPDAASARERMVYASAADAFREKLGRIARILHITCIDDIDDELLVDRLRLSNPSSPRRSPSAASHSSRSSSTTTPR